MAQLVALALDGIWHGVSTTHNNIPTQWQNTRLTFQPSFSDPNIGSIVGCGVSLRGAEETSFVIQGGYNIAKRSVSFSKCHTGALAYGDGLSDEPSNNPRPAHNCPIAHHGEIRMRDGSICGQYPDGNFMLVKHPNPSKMLSLSYAMFITWTPGSLPC
jgi:hypothetical protein